ncbi:DUF6745 domain-containing protein [Nocardia sp. NPDC059240]|uniref:DUF6745 domain-containing protein n=1 Tax=Nocardia sp. NPDC059240 TaxID=3346786 RepID=UPI0036901EAC
MQNLDEWRAVAAATGPADRPAAEAAARRAYKSAGLAAPTRYVWAASPLAAVNAIRALHNPGRSVRDEVRTRPWAAERRSVHDRLGPTGWSELWNTTGARLWDTTRILTDRITTGVVEAAVTIDPADRRGRAVAERDIQGLLLDAVLGQHDAAWLSAFPDSERLSGLAGVARHAGWWWPFEHTIVFTERPTRLLRDEAGRLHAADGPALVYPDGFALHAWRGMPVPATLFEDLVTLTAERIRTEENAELRRVMLEFFGYDRYLAESGARPIDRDETGILWCIELDDDEDVVMVEVVNSTPEPDGTHRTYWLRVPPGTRTAKEGVAWTFSLETDHYAPVRQT